MNFQEDQVFEAIFITRGRISGNRHVVKLKAVYHNKMIYFSRRNPNSDWLRNAIVNPDVILEYNNESLIGKASLVIDKDLAQKISHIKYSDERSKEPRVVLQVKLCE